MIDKYNAILETVPSSGNGASLGVKANISVKGHACHGGIKAYENDIASEDALVVQRLRDADYSITAILNMEEGALGAQTDNPWFGKTFNPLKAGYTPGGSSGGSAAAVSGYKVHAALGTDTMGSVRVPSAYCGLWGFKPSHDPEMLRGVMPLSPTLDTVGAHGHSLEDVFRITEIICGRNFDGGVAGEISVLDWQDFVQCDEDVKSAFLEFVAKREGLQSTNIEPYGYGKSRRAGLIISEVEGYDVHKERLEKDPSGFSEFFRGMLEFGSKLPKEKVDQAYSHVRELREAKFPDFILMPTAPQTAFKFGSPVPVNQADFTAFANLADLPAIQFPIAQNSEGLPIGAQLVGPRGREADLVVTVKTLFN